MPLRRRLFVTYLGVVLVTGLAGIVAGVRLLGDTVVREAQTRATLDLRAAWSVYRSQTTRLETLMRLLADSRVLREGLGADPTLAARERLELTQRQYDLDFLTLVDKTGVVRLRSQPPYNQRDYRGALDLVHGALQGRARSGTVELTREELALEGHGLPRQAYFALQPTPRAKPTPEKELTSGIVLLAAAPFLAEDGAVQGAVYGGVLLSRDYALADEIQETVFRQEKFRGKALGTVTIFQWDVRIATTVRAADGNRAIGTRLSAEVYDNTLENGRPWVGRAFVVNDWYLSAYEPIRDPGGRIVGCLYVGILESKYAAMRQRVIATFGGLAASGLVAVLILSYVLALRITRPVERLAEGAHRLADGHLDHRVAGGATTDEIGSLVTSFNSMAEHLQRQQESLAESQRRLAESNRELETRNRDYMEMLGFVSHELKNPIATARLSVESLLAGNAGELSSKQREVVARVSRNAAYLEGMVRNYLDLSRIEQGELEARKQFVVLRADILDRAVSQVTSQLESKGMALEMEVPEDLVVHADPDLLTIVLDNLIGNAAKYGREGGRIRVTAERDASAVHCSVWNEGDGIPADQLDRLFQKFSRLPGGKGPRQRGTGLGLFVTRQILELHGGHIGAQSEEGSWVRFFFDLPLPADPDANAT
jgi:two-component system NtrC family sensor kinase